MFSLSFVFSLISQVLSSLTEGWREGELLLLWGVSPEVSPCCMVCVPLAFQRPQNWVRETLGRGKICCLVCGSWQG